MEAIANTEQNNKPVQPTPQNVSIQGIKNQLQYPFDYQTQRALDEYLRSFQAFPVGGVFISVVSTNPATLLGYGTWTAFATGRTLVAIDVGQTEFDTVEETGGSKTHTLSIAEMPSHTHDSNNTSGSASAYAFATVAGNSALTITGSTGGNGAHNNMSPYIVTYMWKRTA